MSLSKRRAMIDKEYSGLSIVRQCKLLKVSRSSVYSTRAEHAPATLALMHEIDRIFTQYPFFGSRQIAAYLPRGGFSAGRHHGLEYAENPVMEAVEYFGYQRLSRGSG